MVTNGKIFFILFLTQLNHIFGADEPLASNDSSVECENHDVIITDNGTVEIDDHIRKSVKFYMLNSDNQTIELNSTNLDLVNTTKPTKIMVHGLGAHENHIWIDRMASLYHTRGDYNILAVDWTVFSTKERVYVLSAIDSVGQVIANFIVDITEENIHHLGNIHLIGSSVGAHVAGGAAQAVAVKTGKKVDRVTGLDPMEPVDLQVLNKDDANFVDVVHTTVALGKKSVGTVDFYVGGDEPDKPVCRNDSCGDLLADDYYSMTILEADRFEGVSCQNATANVQRLCDKASMGEYVDRSVSGNYLVAKDSAPCLHLQGKYLLLYFATSLILWCTIS